MATLLIAALVLLVPGAEGQKLSQPAGLSRSIAPQEGERPGWWGFQFFKGRLPVSDETSEFGWAMDGPIVCGRGHCADEGLPSEARQLEYTFKADYRKLVAKADAEIIAMAGTREEGIRDHRWELHDNVSIIISSGRFDPTTGSDLDEKGWVRVTLHHYYPVYAKRIARTAFKVIASIMPG